MRKNNLALKRDVTSGGNFADSYLGNSSITRLIRKTREGKKIEDGLEGEAENTASVREDLPEVEIMPRKNFELALDVSSTHSIILKKWNGYVESRNGEEFTAVLIDSFGKYPDIKASFSIDEVSEGDRDLVVENALFDWVISRDRKLHGQIENKDFLIFRRLPMWKKSDFEAKSAKVDAFNAWLNSSTTP